MNVTTPTRPLHVLLVSNTYAGSFLGGADRDWVNLLNAIGPEHMRVTWVGITGSDELRRYVDPRVLIQTLDVAHPCIYDFVNENASIHRTGWLWAKIITKSALLLGRCVIRLRRALPRERVDVVVTNTAVPMLGACFAVITRRPHVWNVKEYLDPKVRGCRRYARLITRCSAAVVVPSRSTGEAFGSGVHVLPDGADLNDVRSRVRAGRTEVLEQIGLPTDLPMVAQVGTISRRKGQHVTAEAFVRLAGRGGSPMFSLVFFGTGSPEEVQVVADVIAQAPSEWRAAVRFDVMEAGDLSQLAAADIVVHPSTIHDCYPNAVREAMTLGRPVIASAMGGIVDMIADGETGLLIPPDDSAALAFALELLATRPDLRQRLGSKAAVFAEQHFDVHELKQAFLELLTQVSQR